MSCDNEYKLKPCPFCGGEATLEYVEGYFPNAFVVICTTCFAETCNRWREHQAVEDWNRRVGEAE